MNQTILWVMSAPAFADLRYFSCENPVKITDANRGSLTK